MDKANGNAESAKTVISAKDRRSEKKPVLFDDHLDPSLVELQYYVDSRIGKDTCKAHCEFCFLDKPHVAGFKQDVDKATRIIGSLREQGYKVIPMVADSFSENGKYLRSGLFKNNDEWYFGNAAWSSGRPLLEDNCEEMLDLCVWNNIHTIIMTSHGTEHKERPFKGLTQPGVVRDAVQRIREFSAKRNWEFRITLTFTLSRMNMSPEQILKYFDYCEKLDVDVIRFNRFSDMQNKYPELRLSKDEVIETYKNLKEIYDGYPGKVQMSVSEDFGSWGVDIMGFPKGVGHCVAGERLFGVIYPNIYVCPVNLTVVIGRIRDDGQVEWDQQVVQQVLEAKKNPLFGGCIGVAYPHFKEIRDYFEKPSLVANRSK